MSETFITKDSGKRETFNTGAVRDMRSGKGRYDLISPIALERIALVYGNTEDTLLVCGNAEDTVKIARYDLIPTIALKRLAGVYERGAIKYNDDRNWENGMPICRTLDSALRHMLQYHNNETDEDHLAQSAWNIIAAMHFEDCIQNGILPTELDDTSNYQYLYKSKLTFDNNINLCLQCVYRYISGARDFDYLAITACGLFDIIKTHNPSASAGLICEKS